MSDFRIPPLPNPTMAKAPAPGALDVFEAGVAQESGFGNILTSIQRQRPAPDPNFQLGPWLQERKDLVPYRDYFLKAESQREAELLEQQLNEELRRKALLESGGFAGFAGQITGAILSPSTFIPVAGAATKLKTIGKISALAAGSAALDEFTLQQVQLTRSGEDSAANILGAALLGTVLGSAVAALTPVEARAALKNITGPMKPVDVERPMPLAIGDGSIGARAVNERPNDPGPLLGMLRTDELDAASPLAKLHNSSLRVLGVTSPVVRNLSSDVPVVRAWQARLATAELQHRADSAITPGGTVERRVAYKERALLQTADVKLQDHYAQYRLGKPEVTRMESNVALLKGMRPNEGKLSVSEFNERVALEMQIPQADQIPEVVAAAADLRREVYEPLMKELVEVGIIPKEIAQQIEEGNLRGAISYLNHVYNKDMIEAYPLEFEALLRESYQEKMTAAYAKQAEKVQAANARAEEEISLLSKSDEEAQALQDQIAAERKEFLESETADIRSAINELKDDLKKVRREIYRGSNQQRIFSGRMAEENLVERIKKLEELLDEDAREAIKRDNELRRKSTLLSKSIGRLSDRQARAISSIEALESKVNGILRRVSKKIAKFDAELDSLSDEAYAQGVRELEAEMAETAIRLDDLEERIHRFQEKHPEIMTGPTSFATRIQRFRSQILPGGKLTIETEQDRAEAIWRLNEVLSKEKLPSGAVLTDQQRKSVERLVEDISRANLREAADVEKAFARAWRLEEDRYDLIAKMDRAAKLLDDAELEGPEYARAVLKEWQDDVLTDVQLRQQKLSDVKNRYIERARALDPEHTRKRISKTEARIIQRGDELGDWLRERGGEMGDDGVPNFSEGAQDFAREIRQKIQGDPTKMPALEVMAGKRGPELARVLDLPLEKKMRFLENDVSKLAHIYVRTVVPDVELTRSKVGVRGERVAKDVMKAYEAKIKEVADATELPKKRVKIPGVSPKTLEEWKVAETQRLFRERDAVLKSFEGQIERLRHQRAIPNDPDAYLYRGARALMSLNTASMMGNVLISSVTDMAVAVWRYGLTDVFKYALKPYLKGLKEVRITKREALYYGMNEVTHQARYYQIADMFETIGRQTRAEKAIDFAANKIGIVGLFAYWNQWLKTALTPIVAGKLLDSIDVVVNGAKHMPLSEARRVMATMQIDEELGRRIMAEREGGGLIQSNGLWVPNTETWKDAGAREAFRVAVLSEMDVAVNTPGVERPLFMDATMPMKMLTQFQSFMWSSHVKILLAGLQEPDRKILEGVLVATALGAMAYYFDMMARGRLDEVEDHTLGDWADNILVRSPFLGVLGQARETAEAIPATRPYVTFSDAGASTRRFGMGPLESVLGPSFTTGKRVSEVLSQIDSPTAGTVDQVQRMMPYNNVFYLRWLFDTVGDAMPVPEKREAGS